MTRYTIYTEHLNRVQVLDFAAQALPSFTAWDGPSCYQGKREKALVIEYIGSVTDQAMVLDLARTIKDYNKQESVLVVMSPIDEMVSV